MTDAVPCCCQAAVPSQLQPRDVGTVCGFCPFKGRTWLGQTGFPVPVVLALCGCCPGQGSWAEVAGLCLWPPDAGRQHPPVPLPTCSNNQAP